MLGALRLNAADLLQIAVGHLAHLPERLLAGSKPEACRP